ncbi:MAG: outer membrane protein assembly factor [Gammaproteobacteria bacterium]|nr:outer membrane protein assembly factor [Gammaproteobacteria bacterium]
MFRFSVTLLTLLWFGSALAAVQPELDIDGADAKLEENIRTYLNVEDRSCERNQGRQRLWFAELNTQLRNAAEALGYYRASFTPTVINNNKCWELTIDVIPGEQMKIAVLDIQLWRIADSEKLIDPEFDALLKNFPLHVGDPVNHANYEFVKSELLTLSAQRGYLNARFVKNELRIDIEKNQASITIVYEAGARAYFGDITLEIQNNFLDEDFVRRFIKFKKGDYFEAEKLIDLRRNLSNARYFNTMNVTAPTEQVVDQFIPVNIKLSPRARNNYSVGAGIATDTGVRGKLGYDRYWLNKQGHQFSSELLLSKVLSEINGVYKIPLEDPSDDIFNIKAGFQTQNTDTEEHQTYSLGVDWTNRRHDTLLVTRSISFQRETYIVADQEERNVDLLMPGINWTWSESLSSLYPKRGHYFSLDVRGAHEDFLSDVSFFEVRPNARIIRPLLAGRILGRLTLGAISIEDVNALPASIRFYAGGDSSVRGYAYQSLGPLNDEGEIIGGKNLATASLEYDWRFVETWGVAVFTDAGNAFNEELVDVKKSVGVGVRWYTVIAPVRLDIAFPYDDPSASDYRIHLSLGVDL